jgi:hypothetical protein
MGYSAITCIFFLIQVIDYRQQQIWRIIMIVTPFTRTQVAQATGKSHDQIKQMINDGELTTTKRGIMDSAIRETFGEDVLTTLKAQTGRSIHPLAL